MTVTVQNGGPAGGQMRQVNILDSLVLVAEYKRFILRFVGITMLVAVVLLYLVIPRYYKSTAVVMPPQQKTTMNLGTALARATAPLRGLGIGQASEETANLRTILDSRRVRAAMVEKFDLQRVYDVDTLDKALLELEGNMVVVLGKQDVSIEITVYDTDAIRAADMANYSVELLNRVYTEIAVTEARANRLFVQERYERSMRELKAAEDSMRAFQETFGVYSIPDQVKAAVEAAAAFEAKIALKEVEQRILASKTSGDNPLRESLEIELRELRQQLRRMKTGAGEAGSLVFPAFAKAPEIGIKYFRHYRDVEIQSKILELVLPWYEQAKLEEQRNTPSVNVLDIAVPASRPSKPKRLILLAVVLLVSLLVAFLVAMMRDSSKRRFAQMDAAEAAKVAIVKRELSLKNLFRRKTIHGLD